MPALSTISLIGHITEPESRFTPNGAAVLKFSLAVNPPKGQERPAVWYRVSVFGRQVEWLTNDLRKGSLVYVQGRLDVRPYNDRSGTQQLSLDVTAETCKPLDRRETEQEVPF